MTEGVSVERTEGLGRWKVGERGGMSWDSWSKDPYESALLLAGIGNEVSSGKGKRDKQTQ